MSRQSRRDMGRPSDRTPAPLVPATSPQAAQARREIAAHLRAKLAELYARGEISSFVMKRRYWEETKDL